MISILAIRPLFVVSCLRLPYNTAVLHLKEFFAGKPSEWLFHEFPGTFHLNQVYIGMPPAGGAHKRRVGIIDRERVTVLVANLQDGWSSLAHALSSKTGTDAFVFSMSDSARLANPINGFTYVMNGRTIRHVSVIKEDKWVFHQQGLPLPEEEVGAYKSRLKKDRLGPESVESIANKLGFAIGAVDFYEPTFAGLFSEGELRDPAKSLDLTD